MTLQHRMRMDPVVEIAVVEGEHDGFLGHVLAAQKRGKIVRAERAIARAREIGHLLGEVFGLDRDHSRRRADMVIY